MSQNVLNLVDTGMVGHCCGSDVANRAAVAAVGLGGFTNFLAIAFILGLSAGVQAMSSRRMGEGLDSEAAHPLNGGILLALSAALPLSLILYNLTEYFYPYLSDDPDVLAVGVPYLEWRLLAGTAVGINFSFRGFWNGIHRSLYYMLTLLVMHALNIFFNWLFIFGNLGMPQMGAEGAGFASMLAMFCGTAIYFFIAIVIARPYGFLRARPSGEMLGRLIRLSVPSGLQQLFFSGGLVALFKIIETIGTAEVAAANIMVNVMLFAYLPAMGLGLGAATMVGNALGRGDPRDAKQWGWDVVNVAMVVLVLLALPMMVIPDQIIGIFIQDERVIDIASLPLRITGIGLWSIEAVGLVLMNALLGAGASRIVMLTSIGFQWFVFLPVAAALALWLGFGLVEVWIANMGYRALLALTFAYIWHRGDWQSIKV